VTGRDNLRDYFGPIFARAVYEELHDLIVYETDADETIIAEFTVVLRFLEGDRVVSGHYIVVVHSADGQIDSYRDYWNPLAMSAPADTQKRRGQSDRQSRHICPESALSLRRHQAIGRLGLGGRAAGDHFLTHHARKTPRLVHVARHNEMGFTQRPTYPLNPIPQRKTHDVSLQRPVLLF
jgi:hypothetical protein